MSTRATITLKTKDNKYKSIYLHHDGYIEGAGYTLKTYYPTYDKVDQLLNLGNLSSLGKTPVDDPKLWDMDYYFDLMKNNPNQIDLKCRTYKGRGDQDEDAIIVDELNDDNFYWQSYNYLFENGKWYLVEPDGDKIEF